MKLADCAGLRSERRRRLQWKEVNDNQFLLTISGNVYATTKDAFDATGLERAQNADGSWIRTPMPLAPLRLCWQGKITRASHISV